MPVPFPDISPVRWPGLRFARGAGLALVLAGLVAGCRNARERAVLELERRGVRADAAALTEAVRQGSKGVIRFLEQAGVRAEVPPAGEPSVLHLAARSHDWALMGDLLRVSGPEVVNHPGPAGQGILEQTVTAGQYGAARQLLDAGARPESSACGAGELIRFLETRDPALADRLLDLVPEGHESLGEALLRASASGSVERVRRLLQRRAPAETVSREGNGSPLELACQGGFSPVAQALIQAGARPAGCPAALIYAVERRDAVLVKMLLEAGADPNAPAVEGAVPPAGRDIRLTGNAESGALKTVPVLAWRQPGGDFDAEEEEEEEQAAAAANAALAVVAPAPAGARDHGDPHTPPAASPLSGQSHGTIPGEERPSAPEAEKPLPLTPLDLALEDGQTDLVRLMLPHGADAARCLDFALDRGDTALLNLMLDHGAPLDQPGADGNPPLVRAAAAGQAETVSKLLAKGAPRDQPGAMKQTAYHMAVIHRRPETVAVLLEAGARADEPFVKPAPPELIPLFESDYFSKWYRRDTGLTPLMLAASRGDTEMVRLLLKRGAKRGAQTTDWHRYPIVFACDTVNLPAAQLLLGRDPDKEEERRHAVVSLSRQRVTLYKNDQPVRSARVSTGKKSTPTPPGRYIITDKQTDWTSSIYKVPMPFFMRLSCKEIGLHAGVVPGYPASHGCIRMPRNDVQAFFKILKIGDPVTIEP